jgi:hypothetical protein
VNVTEVLLHNALRANPSLCVDKRQDDPELRFFGSRRSVL